MTTAMIPWLLASYLVGAIPTSYLTARLFRGIDLREHGSRNLGATNLYRVLGWKFAIPVGLFDTAKGLVPVLVFAPRASSSQLFALVCGMMAVLGHVYSVFVGFKGGKGVATAAGVMLALTPAALGVSFAVWLVVVVLTGYVSLGSIVSAAVFPVAVRLLDPPGAAGDSLARCGRGRGDHLAPSREHPAPAQGHRESLRPAGGVATRGTDERHRGAGRGELGHDARQPARVQGRNGTDLGVRARGGRGDQSRPRRTRCFCRAFRSPPRLRADADLREAVAGAGDRLGARRAMRCAAVVAAGRRTPLRRARSWSAHQGHRDRHAGADVARCSPSALPRVPIRRAVGTELRRRGVPGAADGGRGRGDGRRPRRATPSESSPRRPFGCTPATT